MANTTEKVYSLKIEGLESVNDLKKAIEELNDKLSNLKHTSKEYKDTLEEINRLQNELKNAIENLGEVGSDVINSFLNGFVEGLNEAASATTDVKTSTIELDDTLTKEADSMAELKKQINGLKDRLVQLDVDSKEYKETVELLVEKNNRLQSILQTTKTTVSGLTGSYNALTQEMSALKKRWKETNDEAERNEIGKRINEINNQLKEMDATIGNNQRKVGSYEEALMNAFGNPREKIKKLRLELANLEVGSQRYNEVVREMADLTQKQKHFNDQLAFSSSNLEDILKNMAGAAAGIVGGFSALNAAMGLFGEENEDIQKAMLKTQQMIALVQGLNGLAGMKDRIVGLIDGIKGFIGTLGKTNKELKQFQNTEEGTATSAEKATIAVNAESFAANALSKETNELSKQREKAIQTANNEYQAEYSKLLVIENEISANEKLRYTLALLEYQNGELDESQKELVKETEEYNEELQSNYQSQLTSVEAAKMKRDTLEKEKIAYLEIVDPEMAHIEAMKAEQQTIEEGIVDTMHKIQVQEDEIKALKTGLEISEKKENVDEKALDSIREYVAEQEKSVAELRTKLSRDKADLELKKKTISAEEGYIKKIRTLNAELQKKSKFMRAVSISTKLEIYQTKQAAAGNLLWAGAIKVVNGALKGLKYALISTGVGALIVLLGELVSLLGKGLGSLRGWITGANKAKDALEGMNGEIAGTISIMEQEIKFMESKSATAYKKNALQIKTYIGVLQQQKKAYETIKDFPRQLADEIDELTSSMDENRKKIQEITIDSITDIDKMLEEVEKTNRQSGMTQLEKDMEELNTKFQDSIDLLEEMKNQIPDLVKIGGKGFNQLYDAIDNRIKRIRNDWKLAQDQLTAKSTSGKTGGKSEYEKQMEEANKLYKQLVENSKREEQKLKEKYEKEKALLEKFHKDTTLLTKKYYEDLDKLLTQRQKAEYDKWVAHLNSLLNIEEQNSISYFEKEIENMQKIFAANFGASEDNPFKEFFNIEYIDEFGSKTIQITEDIAESMKMMGLDPHNIDDIQTMIDKWETDKKAIEDAKKALAKFKSELKFKEFESESNAIDAFMQKRLEDVEKLSEEISSASFHGFYSGLSPQDEQEAFEARYRIIEEYLNKEADVWKAAMEDETLSAEDRNTALQKYNQVMAQQNAAVVQKTIDANNLLIKSFERISDSISSMANNLASILGSVSDVIMDTAQAEYDAGNIKEEAYKKQFEKAKALQIAQATINTIAGAVGAFMGITKDTGGWGIAAAAIEAAAVLAAGYAQIAQIRNTTYDSSGSGGGNGSTTFQLPSVMTPEPTRTQNFTNQSDIDSLANAIGDRIGEQRVIVVSSDITNQQKKDRKVDVETSF